MNLIDHYPRSSRKKLVGLFHILRMIDKENAKRYSALSEYILPCPMYKIVLKFLDISEAKFVEKI